MNEYNNKKYCCMCNKEIIIGDFCDANHQKYNLFAHMTGQPMFCSNCWHNIQEAKDE